MPIDYKKYPANWKTEIRPSILERANNRCERCKVPNKALILRSADSPQYQDMDGNILCADTGEYVGSNYLGVFKKDKPVTIVLTIAHLNHDITDNSPSNLQALCQRCHNRHDIEYRKGNRAKSYIERKYKNSLFPD